MRRRSGRCAGRRGSSARRFLRGRSCCARRGSARWRGRRRPRGVREARRAAGRRRARSPRARGPPREGRRSTRQLARRGDALAAAAHSREPEPLARIDREVAVFESVRTEWGSRLIPVAELERYVADRREEARRAHRLPTRPGRRPGLPAEVVRRIRSDHATSQGGRQWWPSTVRASRPLKPARLRPAGLDRDEFADRRVARAGLEAHHEPDLECLREPFERRDARSVLARLDS